MTSIITVQLEFPRSLATFARRLQAAAEAVLQMHAQLSEHKGAAVDYGDIERRVSKELGELGALTHHDLLAALDVDAPYVRVWGNYYRRTGRHPGCYHCPSGEVEVERTTYRRLGGGSEETVDAISLRAGVICDGWLPQTARAMAHLMARGTSREAADTATELMSLPYSRSSFERVGHAVGAQVLATRQRVEQAMIESFDVPPDATSLSVSLDRVSIPMEEPIEPAPRKTARSRELDAELARLKPRFEVKKRALAVMKEAKREAQKAKKRKVERNFRMAYCATVTLHDHDGEALHTIRYGRMPQGDIEGLLKRLVRDVHGLRSKRQDLRVVLLADGAPEMWNLMTRHLNKETLGCPVVEIVDYWHMVEYLAPAAAMLERDANAWPGQLRRWKQAVLEKPGGIKEVLKQLQDSGLKRKSAPDGTKPVAAAIRYVEKRVRQMRYAAARRLGLPIGSGNVEATCKSLFALRMKRPGARWKTKGAEEVLALRALYLSDRWDQGIELSCRPLHKAVATANRVEALRLVA